MIEEPNGNGLINPKRPNNNAATSMPTSPSNDDLSQSLSLSEYTDADESMSAPTEFLAEVGIHHFQSSPILCVKHMNRAHYNFRLYCNSYGLPSF